MSLVPQIGVAEIILLVGAASLVGEVLLIGAAAVAALVVRRRESR